MIRFLKALGSSSAESTRPSLQRIQALHTDEYDYNNRVQVTDLKHPRTRHHRPIRQ